MTPPSSIDIEELTAIGLDPAVPTGLVLFGGAGSPAMIGIARRLGSSSRALQLIAICGRNGKLKRALAALTTTNRLFVEGFTQAIPYYMGFPISS